VVEFFFSNTILKEKIFIRK